MSIQRRPSWSNPPSDHTARHSGTAAAVNAWACWPTNLRVSQEAWIAACSIAATAASRYETIAQAAQHDRWAALLHTSGPTDEQVDDVLAADTFGALSAELRRAEANHHDVEILMPRLVQARTLDDADDIAAVLHERLARGTTRPAKHGRTRRMPRLIAGLIPEAIGTSPDMQQALTERQELIEKRSEAQLQAARAASEPWTAALGSEPTDPGAATRWRQHARTVAAYRDRYGITAPAALGPTPDSTSQKIDAARAGVACDRARALVESPDRMPRPGRPSAQRHTGHSI